MPSPSGSVVREASYLSEIARSVVRYHPAVKTALREFQRTFFGAQSHQCDDAFFSWLFERNPHRDPAGVSLWLCQRDGVVVGQQASIPSILKVGETEQRGGWLIDWIVHPQWRLKGVSPAMFAAYSAHTDVMLGLGLEDLAYRTVKRGGWTDVGRLSLFVRPLDPAPCAAALNAPSLAGVLVPRFALQGSARLAARIMAALTRTKLQPIPAFDEEADRIWALANPDYPILVKRDFEYLRWRFDEGPHRALYERYYLVRRGRVVGYLVLRLANWRGHVVGRVVDYLVERRSLAPLLALAIEELSAKKAIAVFFEQCHAAAEPLLRALGCLNVRPAFRKRFMIDVRDRQSPLAATLARSRDWFITPGDGDFEHILIDPPPGEFG